MAYAKTPKQKITCSKNDIIRQFDDLDRELIDTLLRTFCTLLEINKPVSFVDKEQMISIYYYSLNKTEKTKEIKDLDYVYGSAFPEDRIIYLNPRLCKRNYQNMVDTMIHELLHIKFPDKKENEILDLERNLTGRYDYTIKEKQVMGDIRCKVGKN